MIEVYRIVRQLRDPESVLGSRVDADFELELEGSETIEAFLARPGVSLYALDHDRRGVAFVETKPGDDLISAPFLHQAQRTRAKRLFRVPYDTFFACADTVRDASGPPLLLYSVGRCGSTLVSRMIREVPGVASVSEPDIFSNVEAAVATGVLSDDEAVAVLRGAVRLATHGLAPKGAQPAIKFRSEVVWIADLIDRAVPEARTLFMYRDARRVIESSKRVFVRAPGWRHRLAHVPLIDRFVTLSHRRQVRRQGPRFDRFALAVDNATPTDIEQRGTWGKHLVLWLAKVQSYLRLRERRPDVAALRYEDLVTSPEIIVRGLFETWGLPPDSVAAALETMDRDSQSGTLLHRRAGRAWRLSRRDEREIARTFRENTSLSGPDAVLPGTLSPGAPA